jgi:hypothetical protein
MKWSALFPDLMKKSTLKKDDPLPSPVEGQRQSQPTRSPVANNQKGHVIYFNAL